MSNKPSAVLAEFEILINGAALSASELQGVKRIEIERGLKMADRCEIVLADPHRYWAQEKRPGHGATVEVKIPYEGEDVVMFTEGRIGRLDVSQERKGGSFFHIVAYGPRYTLGKGSQAQTFTDASVGVTMQDAAKASGVQGKAGSTPTRPYTLQANVANRALIEEFAARTGLVIQEEGEQIDLSPPSLDSSLTLTYGLDLIEFKSEVNTLGPLAKVQGTAHDYSKKAVWSHDVSAHRGSAKGWTEAGAKLVGEKFGETPYQLADLPVKNQSELESLVQAAFEDRAYSFVTGEGQALGLPKLKPGVSVELEGLGNRMSGAYYVTRVVHRLSPENGYTVHFEGCRPSWGAA